MAKAKKEKVVINLNADLTGFASASRPSLSHEKIAGRFASPFLGGPPKNRDLMDLMAHMFTDEEADLVQHLPLFRPRTVEKVAALAGRSVEESRRVLDNLAFRDAALALGWSLRENRRNQRHCAGTNHCILGCPTGAKQSTLESYIPRIQWLVPAQ